MKPNPKIVAAVAAILSASSTAIVYAQQVSTAPAAATGNELQEVVVTAERRSENIQDVPITIQAISGEQLKQLNVVSFNDLIKYTPT
jgi:iron complex outermembrane receptor protein